MIRGQVTVAIPNPHGSGIGVGLLSAILRQAGVSTDERKTVEWYRTREG